MRQSRLRLFAASLASLGASVALAQSSQVTASAEGTTSAPVAAVSQTPANRPTIDLLFWPTVSMDGKDKTMTYNYVGTSYQFSNKMKLGVRQIFETTNEDGKQGAKIQDTYLEASRSGVALTNNGLSLTSIGRLYLPTGKDSVERGQVAQMRGYFTFSQEVSVPLTISYTANPRMFLQSRDSAAVDGGALSATPDYTYIHWVDFTYSLNSWITLEQSVVHINRWYRSDSSKGFATNRKEAAELISSVYFKVSPQLTIQAFFDHEHAINHGGGKFNPYDPKENTFNLTFDAKI